MIAPEPKPPIHPPSAIGGTPGSSGKPPTEPINPSSASAEELFVNELDLQADNGQAPNERGVTFSYHSPYRAKASILHLRLPPESVSWNYNVVTNITDTYAGQVVQILGINIDKLTIQGRFGKETPHGAKLTGPKGFQLRTDLGETDEDIWDWELYGGGTDPNQKYAVGLTQMTTFFREYFAINTQGGDPNQVGDYVQVPMFLTYPNRRWTITPVSFPSYRRSIQDFAPEWKVEAYVIEKADLIGGANGGPSLVPPTLDSLHIKDMQNAVNRILKVIGYPDKEHNPWSSPFPNITAPNSADAEHAVLKAITIYKEWLPNYTKGDVLKMLWQDISVPTVFDLAGISTAPTADASANQIAGEITGPPHDPNEGTPPGMMPHH